MYQKKEKILLQKMSPRLSQLNVAMAHRNYFRRNNLWILKLATNTKNEDHYLGANWQLFRLEIKDCQMFIFYFCLHKTKFYWFVMKIKKCMLPIWWYNRDLFPLGNKYLGSSFWMGQSTCIKFSWLGSQICGWNSWESISDRHYFKPKYSFGKEWK